jgi:hypothetical protein
MADPGVQTPKSRRLGSGTLWVLGTITWVGLVLWVSRVTAPSYDELDRLAAVDRAEAVVRTVAQQGLGALRASGARAQLGAPSDDGVLGALLGAWARLSVGRIGLLDALTSARLPWLVLGSMAPLGLYWLARPSLGPGAARLAAVLLALHPAWLHAVAVTAESAWTVSFGVLVLGACLESLAPRVPAAKDARVTSPPNPSKRRWLPRSRSSEEVESPPLDSEPIRPQKPCWARLFWAMIAAIVLGLGLAFGRSTLWTVLILLTHYALARRARVRRLLAMSEWPVPAAALMGMALGPLVAWMLTPVLWAATPLELARWWLAPLDLAALPGELQGLRGIVRPLHWVLTTTPGVTLACILAGLIVALERRLPGRSPPSGVGPDPRALGMLIGVGLAFTLVLPPWWPRVLSAPVPRFEACLPWLALAGGWGADRFGRRWLGERRARWGMAGVTALALASLLTSDLGTLGVERLTLATRGDGSELGALAAPIDALGATRLTIAAPDVPPRYWQALADWKRMRTHLVGGLNASADLVLLPSAAPGGEVVAAVRHRGLVVWALRRP